MERIKGLLHRGKTKEQLNSEDHIYATNIFSSENNRSPSDIEMERDLGTNIHMIEDSGLMAQIQEFCKYPIETPTEIKVLPDGTTTVKNEILYMTDWNMITLRALCTKVVRTSWIDPKDADIYKEMIEYEIEELKEKLSSAEYDQRGAFYDAIKMTLLTAIDDAVNGRKARLLKVQLKGFELSVQHNQPSNKNPGGSVVS